MEQPCGTAALGCGSGSQPGRPCHKKSPSPRHSRSPAEYRERGRRSDGPCTPLHAAARVEYALCVSIGADQLTTDDCYRCGYDLRGIANDRACPECGLLAERSRRVSDELHNTRPRWLRKLARGVWLMLLSLVMLFVLPIVADQLRTWLYNMSRFGGFWWRLADLLSLVSLAIPAVMFLLGVLSLTAREQYGPADQDDRRRRWLLRVLAPVPLLGTVAAILTGSLFLRHWPYTEPQWILFAVSVGVLGPSIPLPILLFYQLRSLAKRARSAHLAEHCAIVGIGTSLAVFYATALVILFQFAEQWGLDRNWTSRSPVSLILFLVSTVSASLFALWSFYLLVRFAIALHFAARHSIVNGRSMTADGGITAEQSANGPRVAVELARGVSLFSRCSGPTRAFAGYTGEDRVYRTMRSANASPNSIAARAKFRQMTSEMPA